ncbi:hypothetical protein ACJX0J_039166, partial [Zea mays]
MVLGVWIVLMKFPREGGQPTQTTNFVDAFLFHNIFTKNTKHQPKITVIDVYNTAIWHNISLLCFSLHGTCQQFKLAAIIFPLVIFNILNSSRIIFILQRKWSHMFAFMLLVYYIVNSHVFWLVMFLKELPPWANVSQLILLYYVSWDGIVESCGHISNLYKV